LTNKHTNKQTPLKTSNAVRYATTLRNGDVSLMFVVVMFWAVVDCFADNAVNDWTAKTKITKLSTAVFVADCSLAYRQCQFSDVFYSATVTDLMLICLLTRLIN